MDIVYLDYNCFQRGFDDPGQIRIQMEALACQEVFVRADRGELRLVWSFMHQDETLLCPVPERQQAALRLADLCQLRVGPEEAIQHLAVSIQAQTNVSAKDALHLACASYANAGFFLTCDDRLLRRATPLTFGFSLMNPVDYVR